MNGVSRFASWLGRVRREHKLVFNLTILTLAIGTVHWNSIYTLDNLQVYCTNSAIAKYTPPIVGQHVIVSVGLRNPNVFPVGIKWYVTAELNNSGPGRSTVSGGLSESTILPFDNVYHMDFYIPDLRGNYTLDRVVSCERHSIFFNIFSEPRIFSSLLDYHIPVDSRTLNRTIANQMPTMLWFIFTSHSDFNSNGGSRCA